MDKNKKKTIIIIAITLTLAIIALAIFLPKNTPEPQENQKEQKILAEELLKEIQPKKPEVNKKSNKKPEPEINIEDLMKDLGI